MSKADSLSTLINSLTKSEKSYFKKFIAGTDNNTDKKYLLLFDAIEKQKDYDEAALKIKFKDEQFVKQFSVAKNYLFNVILKSLKLHQLEASVDNIIFNLLAECDILFKKTLYRESEKKLFKAQELAEKYDKFPALMEVYFRYHRYIIYRASFGESTITDQLYSDQLKTIEKIKELVGYRKISYDYRKISYSDKSPKEKEQMMKDLLKNPLLAEDFKPASIRPQLLYYNVQGLIHQGFYGDHKKAYAINKKFVDLLLSNPDFAAEERTTMLAALNNFMVNIIHLKLEDEFEKYISVMENLEVIYPDDEIRILEKAAMLRLTFYVQTLNIEKGVAYSDKLTEQLNEFEDHINPDFFLAIHDAIVVLYFMNGDFSKSITHINKILQSKISIRWDIQCMAHVLYLIIQYEKKDFDHLGYQLKYAEKFIEQKRGQDSYEIIILNFLKKSARAATEKERLSVLPTLISDLEIALTNSNDQQLLEYFNFIEWAKAKLHGKKYYDHMRSLQNNKTIIA